MVVSVLPRNGAYRFVWLRINTYRRHLSLIFLMEGNRDDLKFIDEGTVVR
jgi:hypothetical protein